MRVSDPPPVPPRVLVVDDERAVRELLRLALRHAGFGVLAAPDGPSAVLLAVWSGPVHVALVDRHMPGMSGEETALALRRLVPGLRVLLMAGEPPVGVLPEGCAGFLQKPFALAELTDRVRALIRAG